MKRKIEAIRENEEGEELSLNNRQAEIPFSQLVTAMLDGNTPLPTRYLYRLSDIQDDDLHLLQKNWHKVPQWRRQAMMDDLQVLVDKDTILSFEGIGRMALRDQDPRVRCGAIEVLTANECETHDLAGIFLEMMENDPDRSVRAIAASALGHFVYLAEMESLPEDIKRNLEDRLLQVAQNHEDATLRCCALESLGYSNREEIPPLIEANYNSIDPVLQSSALVAMGRSGNERWRPQVMSMLTHSNPSIRAEAARAAGELGISESRTQLFDLVDDANMDVSSASLWALSQIGGKGVRKVLQERLHEADDDNEIKYIEDLIDDLASLAAQEIFEKGRG